MNAMGKVAAAPAATMQGTDWRPALIALGIGLVLFGWLFAEEGVAAIEVWNESTAYNHCWLVAPIAAWLAWTRRHRLAVLAPQPTPLLALLAIPPALAWLLAERLGIMEGRQLTAMAMLWVLVLTVMGWPVARAMAAPLSYLIFLVPFGEFATPMLQHITAWMTEIGLTLLGITHYRDGLFIETPDGMYHVAEACAGLRFIIAALAFGALYAFVIFRSPWRRLAVMVLALVVPVFANGLRAMGIVVLGQYLGSAEAAAADHVVYGWGFFSAIILLLILAGLPFREDGTPEPALAPPATPLPAPRPALLAVATGLAVALAGIGPAAAGVLDRAAGDGPRAVAPQLIAPEGCTPVPGEAATLACGPAVVRARLMVFPPRVTWAAIAAERSRLAPAGSDEDQVFTLTPPDGGIWHGRRPKVGDGSTAAAIWLEGRPAGGGLRSRAEQAWHSLAGDGGTPALAVLTLQLPQGMVGNPPRERALLEAVLAAQGPNGLTAQAAALSRTASAAR